MIETYRNFKIFIQGATFAWNEDNMFLFWSNPNDAHAYANSEMFVHRNIRTRAIRSVIRFSRISSRLEITEGNSLGAILGGIGQPSNGEPVEPFNTQWSSGALFYL